MVGDSRKRDLQPERLDRIARFHIGISQTRGIVDGKRISRGLTQFVAEDEKIRNKSFPGRVEIGLVQPRPGDGVIGARKAWRLGRAIALALAVL
jgi:hypothetical protein